MLCFSVVKDTSAESVLNGPKKERKEEDSERLSADPHQADEGEQWGCERPVEMEDGAQAEREQEKEEGKQAKKEQMQLRKKISGRKKKEERRIKGNDSSED
ncbi:hypothetical protein DPEC_G00134040 [Dallia pectoralis]|uniref:Uncharacterized protein n=1 Tax=Dallia pectoralis TaxID=75939 RepID=A0ACC2GRR7_DALPE|nr:hypothetical protein DPEC_G00134040 [Dallia pectoralis]